MKSDKLGKIIAAVRKESPPAPATGFDFLVLQAVQREPIRRTSTVSDQLTALFPRLAGAAVATIALCVAVDWLAAGAQTGLVEGMAQLSQQWFLSGGGI